MIRHFLLLFLVFIVIVPDSFAQNELPEFGTFSQAEINLKETQLDKEAEAIVLLDEAFAHYDEQYQLITDRRVRIKILNQRGLDRANIIIPFYKKDHFEFITSIAGLTYTDNEGQLVSNLARKSIYTENKDENYSLIKFALPNVKVGSIIEYKFTSVMKHYGGLDNWIFQSDIPTIKSFYKLEVLPNSNFSYLLTKKPEYHVDIKQPAPGIVSFEMNNIPGLLFEPFMDAPKDYLQKVEFKLSSFVSANTGSKQTFNSSWKEMVRSLLEDNYGNALKKGLPVPEELKVAVEGEMNVIQKINIVSNYVKNNFTWDTYNSKFIIDGLKKVWDSKKGNSGELNFVLLNLLQSFKIDAKPLLVADRSYGRVDPKYIYLDKFNKTVVWVPVHEKNLIIDVTEKFVPVTLIPYSLLNTKALLVDKNTTDLTTIASQGQAYKTKIYLKAKLDSTGLLKGNCIISSSDYAKSLQVVQIKANQEKFIIDNYKKKYEGLEIENFSYDYKEADSVPLVQKFDISRQTDDNGGFALFNYNLFTDLTKNPFTSDVRFTNINFGYPIITEVIEEIELPDNCKTENLLKDISLDKSSKDIFLSRTIIREGNLLSIKINFVQTLPPLAPDAYPSLKSVYNSIVDKLNEPVVIKMSK